MFIGSALSVIATSAPSITVGVVPEPFCACPGFWMPMFSYAWRQTMRGAPSPAASKR